MHGGPGDIAGEKSIIDWLNGRVDGLTRPAYRRGRRLAQRLGGDDRQVLRRHAGQRRRRHGRRRPEDDRPDLGDRDWYDYSRSGGIRVEHATTRRCLNQRSPTTRHRARRQPAGPPGRSATPTSTTTQRRIDGDDTGDRNTFWSDRDYRKDVGNVKAAVFATHGFQDDNVSMDQLWPWWDGLKANGVPRKLWLLRSGHTDPFDSRRAVWVDTLHRWFDHWLYGVDNGIMSEPAVTIEDDKDVWGEYADWPIPGHERRRRVPAGHDGGRRRRAARHRAAARWTRWRSPAPRTSRARRR